ncbi:MAG: 3-oxoadipate enol-lactonase [Caulobacterales bacterium]|nr:3-oxoadipate enol-lactonase [Caulobacterales bacterium]
MTTFAETDDGVRLHYRVQGPPDGPPLLLSHALGLTHEMWEPQTPALCERWRVVRYDSRGHGRSDAPAGPYALERLGRDALAVMDAVGLSRSAFCGLSLGGMVGLWLAAHAPERVERLVASNTAAHAPPPERWNERIDAIGAHGMAEIVEGVLHAWFTPGFRERAAGEVERVRQMLLATSVEGYAATCAAVRDMDLRPALARITAPTLVIVGAHDPSTPPAAGRAIAAAVPGAAERELASAHMSNVEAARAFTDAVTGFLSA